MGGTGGSRGGFGGFGGVRRRDERRRRRERPVLSGGRTEHVAQAIRSERGGASRARRCAPRRRRSAPLGGALWERRARRVRPGPLRRERGLRLLDARRPRSWRPSAERMEPGRGTGSPTPCSWRRNRSTTRRTPFRSSTCCCEGTRPCTVPTSTGRCGWSAPRSGARWSAAARAGAGARGELRRPGRNAGRGAALGGAGLALHRRVGDRPPVPRRRADAGAPGRAGGALRRAVRRGPGRALRAAHARSGPPADGGDAPPRLGEAARGTTSLGSGLDRPERRG